VKKHKYLARVVIYGGLGPTLLDLVAAESALVDWKPGNTSEDALIYLKDAISALKRLRAFTCDVAGLPPVPIDDREARHYRAELDRSQEGY
jgi:hypothetical protein